MTDWEKLKQEMVYNDFDNDLFLKRVEAKNYSRLIIRQVMTRLTNEKLCYPSY